MHHLREKLTLYGSSFEEGIKEYNKKVVANRLSIVDVLNQFPSVELPLADFLAAVPPLTPRFYSISSSPLVSPISMHITCGVVEYETPLMREYKGVCSHFISQKVRMLCVTMLTEE